MKKLDKVVLGTIIASFSVGIGLSTAGIAMGATTHARSVLQNGNLQNIIRGSVPNGLYYHWDWDDDRYEYDDDLYEYDDDDDDDWEDRVSYRTPATSAYNTQTNTAAATTAQTATTPPANTTAQANTVANSNTGNASTLPANTFANINALDISAEGVGITITRGAGEYVVLQPNLDSQIKLKTSVVNNKLHIDFDSRYAIAANTSTLRIELPAKVFDSIDLEADAGSIHADSLQANRLILSADAGEIKVDQFQANSMEADVNVGKITIAGVANYNNLDTEIGTIQYQVQDKEAAFDYILESDLGKIRYGNQTYTSISNQISSMRGNPKRIEVDVETGSADITFLP